VDPPDGVLVAAESVEEASGVGLPDLHGPVARGRGHHASTGTERGVRDDVRMTGEARELTPGADVPHLDGGVEGGGGEPLAARIEAKRPDSLRVAGPRSRHAGGLR